MSTPTGGSIPSQSPDREGISDISRAPTQQAGQFTGETAAGGGEIKPTGGMPLEPDTTLRQPEPEAVGNNPATPPQAVARRSSTPAAQTIDQHPASGVSSAPTKTEQPLADLPKGAFPSREEGEDTFAGAAPQNSATTAAGHTGQPAFALHGLRRFTGDGLASASPPLRSDPPIAWRTGARRPNSSGWQSTNVASTEITGGTLALRPELPSWHGRIDASTGIARSPVALRRECPGRDP